MPTRDRRPFVRQAIFYFMRQTYANRELVVLDDGDDDVGDLLSGDPRLRHVRVAPGLSLGAKRNAACAAARGELIVHWDDDDWSAPQRLEVQVAALRDADLCGVDRPLFYEPVADRAWDFKDRKKGGWRWVCGATLAFRRSLWERHPFRNFRIGEDDRFVKAAQDSRVMPLPDGEIYIGLIHPGNTSEKETDKKGWRSVPNERIARLLGDDFAFYRGIGERYSTMRQSSSG